MIDKQYFCILNNVLDCQQVTRREEINLLSWNRLPSAVSGLHVLLTLLLALAPS